jgi:hypothetical protein
MDSIRRNQPSSNPFGAFGGIDASRAMGAARQLQSVAQAAIGPFAATQDSFRSSTTSLFDSLRQSFANMGGRLLSNPAVQSALGQFNPMGLLQQARGAAQEMGGTRTLSSRELSASRGDRSFVDNGINAAFGRGPVGMGLVDPSKMQHREFNVSEGAQGRINQFGQSMDRLGKFMNQADQLASKFGINTTLYQKSGQVSTTKTLAGDVNGPNFVGANASANGSVKVGLTGIEAQGHAEAGIEARAGTSGRVEGQYGTAEGSASAQISAKATADGKATLGPNGLTAEGHLYAGVSASAEASGRLESKPFATIGGVPMTLSAEGKAKVEAGAYAYADAKAQATWNPPALAVNAKAGAFAGARASAEGSIGAGPVKATGRAEAWAGIGAEANLDVGYHDGKLSLDFGAGAALGVGFKLGGKIELDVGAIGKMAEGVAKDVEHVAQDVGKAVEHVAQDVGKTVESGVKAVGNAVSNAVSSVGSGISNFVKSIHIF